jgi:tetratricopeptide (TPR) repeat protein
MWLYLPPAILIAALIGLVVILGKKTAALKKTGALWPEKKFPEPVGSGAIRLRKIGGVFLNILERILHLTKVAFRKSEESLAGWIGKVKERRLGEKAGADSSVEKNGRRDSFDIPDTDEPSIRKIEDEELLRGIDEIDDGLEFIGRKSQLKSVIKEETTIIPAKAEVEPMPEDKIREDALIHRIAENPKDIEAYRELGDYYMAVGNIKDAKDSFKMVLRLRPRDLKAKSSLREIEMKMRLGN